MAKKHPPPRRGLRIRNCGGDPDVHRAVLRFARWLRTQYAFPIRVPVYLYPSEILITMYGERVTASFVAPWSRRVEPFIRIATGDYPQLKEEWGEETALVGHLISLAHEVVHYRHWVETGKIWERGVARRAVAITRRYKTVTSRDLLKPE